MAYGTLDEQGRYRLSTYGQGDGAVLGDYRVVVESREATADGAWPKRMTELEQSRSTGQVADSPALCQPWDFRSDCPRGGGEAMRSISS